MSDASILVVDDEPDIRNLVKEILEDEGYRVDVAEDASSARAARLREDPDLVLLDIWMPDEDGVSLLKEWKESDLLHCPVVMMSGHGTVETAVEATRLGAFDFVEKPLSLAKLLLTVEHALAASKTDGQPVKGLVPVQELIGGSATIASLREQADRMAASKAPVLLYGEPGSGKRALARYLHTVSEHARMSFVEAGTFDAEDAGAVTMELESLLAPGKAGTLYVDEVTSLNTAVQKLLLAAVNRSQATQIPRLVLGTTREPQAAFHAGQLLEDLYFAAAALRLDVPPLREHSEDVSALLEYFVNYFAQHEGLSYRHFNLAAQNRLRNYDWPGNVGELRSLVQRLLTLGGDVEIDVAEVERNLRRDALSDKPSGLLPLSLELPLRQAREAFERAYLERQLEVVNGNISDLAKRTGVERTHLYRKLRSLGISPQKNRS